MSPAVTCSADLYTVVGTVRDQTTHQPVEDLHVIAYDKDSIGRDDFLGLAVTDAAGKFSLSFNADRFRQRFFDKKPDLYFSVRDAGDELLNTEDAVIDDADESTPPIVLLVDLSHDKLRAEIQKEPVPGWVGGFPPADSPMRYPDPDLTSLTMFDNMKYIDRLDRQQKVLWPEFSWNSEPDQTDKKRCYQMFAPDISRLGYTNEGRVYSIICPQQGICSPSLGSMNVEVTVTGNRGWADETTKTLAADMTVVGKIWFSKSAHQNALVKLFWERFKDSPHPFPADKERAIVVRTFKPGDRPQTIFPLFKGESESTDFPIPDFARHDEAWTVGHLGVEIGGIEPTGDPEVDEFNQMVLDIFNLGSGNMLKDGNILTWNVWFTAPELVDRDEWKGHALKWRESIDADHGSPDGPGTAARYFDGSPFNPGEALIEVENAKILAWLKAHL